MRLINADEFKRQVVGMAIINNYPADKANKLCELIDTQPTAYDVDKVVEQLEELWKEDVFGKTQMMEIVKAGRQNE